MSSDFDGRAKLSFSPNSRTSNEIRRNAARANSTVHLYPTVTCGKRAASNPISSISGHEATIYWPAMLLLIWTQIRRKKNRQNSRSAYDALRDQMHGRLNLDFFKLLERRGSGCTQSTSSTGTRRWDLVEHSGVIYTKNSDPCRSCS